MGIRPVVVLVCLLWASAAHAQFSVTNTNDSGTGSLREAIAGANQAGGNNTIAITARGTIVLQTALPTVSADVTITGPGAAQLTVQGSATAAPVFTASAKFQISAMTIAGGMHAGANGGGIAVSGGSLVADEVVITGNLAVSGSAIHCAGALTITNSTISGNMGTGAILAAGDTTVVESTISDNLGTAIVFPTTGKTLTIDRSTISGNNDDSGIGGLQLQGGTANIRNSTFSGNIGRQGGDIWMFTNGVTLSLLNVTAAGSSAPSLLINHTATVMLRNTLLAGTGARCTPHSTVTSQGHNLSTDTTCSLGDSTDQQGVDAKLATLASNGGATKTHLPQAGSPALNAGDGASLEPFDQRGKKRIQFGVADIGAVEAVEPTISTQPTAPQALVEGDAFTLTVAAMNQDSVTPLKFQWRKDGVAIDGATEATFTKVDALPEDSGVYDVLVINDGGGLPSKPVTVTVTATIKPDSPPEAGPPEGGDGGGCCSSGGGAAGTNAVLGLALAGFLGVRRRPRWVYRRI